MLLFFFFSSLSFCCFSLTETLQVTNHSWQSMRDRYLKRLRRRLKQNGTDFISSPNSDDGNGDSSPTKRSMSTDGDEMQLFDFLKMQRNKRRKTEADIRRLIMKLSEDCDVQVPVVYHALLTHNGELGYATEYLKNSGSMSKKKTIRIL